MLKKLINLAPFNKFCNYNLKINNRHVLFKKMKIKNTREISVKYNKSEENAPFFSCANFYFEILAESFFLLCFTLVSLLKYQYKF